MRLRDVTLVLIETREHDLAQLALEECERKILFGDVLVFTDRPSQFFKAHRTVISVPDWPEKVGWSRCFWYDVAPYVKTSHVLGIQWDSWVNNAAAWNNEFLRYDYIGAPWWYEDGLNVGNGGFCLRSTKLLRFIRNNRTRFPCLNATDDALYCRTYRPTLQDLGFEWAPVELASSFAFECVQPREDLPLPFGFHAAFNFGKVLSKEGLLHRAQLMIVSPNIKVSGVSWDSFSKHYPDVVAAVSSQPGDLPSQKEN